MLQLDTELCSARALDVVQIRRQLLLNRTTRTAVLVHNLSATAGVPRI